MKKEDNLCHFALQTSIAHCQQMGIERLVATDNFDVNYANSRGETCLHTAARFERIPLAEDLLRLGCDPNAQDSSGQTPLHWAVSQSRVGMVELLVRQLGISLEIKDSRGDSPLQIGNFTSLFHFHPFIENST